jgi:hypothetical protein
MLQAWRQANVLTYAGYILGFPGDIPDTIERDIRIIQRELPIDLLEFFILTPTIRGDRFVLAVCLMNLRQVLGDEAGFDSIAGDERQGTREHVESPQGRELVEHQ